MKWLMHLLFTLVLLAAWSILAYIYVDHTLSSPPRTEPVQLEIPPGTSITEIGRLLKENGLIRQDYFFTAYAWWKGHTNLQAGVYEIPPNETLDGMLQMFSAGKTGGSRVTIPEGYTVEQIASLMERKTGINREDFLRAVNEAPYPYDFVREIPDKPGRRHRLEGYLFPSTYHFPKGIQPEKAVDMMLQQFQRRLTPAVRQRLKEENLTVDEWITVASIVEREGQVKGELPRIAGVIFNRLQRNMKLQVDATVQYALGKQKTRLFYKDLKVDSPYNTYRNEGLPPGPISNPGDDALKAVLYPEKHSYLYYVTKKDGTHEHYFAETPREHELNIERSKKNEQLAEQQ
ncbi:endolytic transglycosylase MltG [Polycladomyces sp. WAk]|uniref:Endolytic murein transglycosylase n=1 Tax=Polycladomyces zharkentensis TaxID=2807616 RepID=A0ABS2WGQ8_9BACL|nr:endolytic transglycosylase MltG [Polycladomyces sp. WAk]MBN2908615.1 endolytic transglycosylase MltG [Polycladomyces sp. WAk]